MRRGELTRSPSISCFDVLRLILALAAALLVAATLNNDQWSQDELKTLRSLSIDGLGPPPADPTNRVADDPAAAQLGRLLFNDARFSSNGKVSCASCHDPRNQLTDARPLGVGVATGNRRTMPVVPAVYSPWQFWDGRADSLWSQALGPVENSAEHGFSRTEVVRILRDHYRRIYEEVFGPFPTALSGDVLAARASPVGTDMMRAAWGKLSEAERSAVNGAFVNFGKAVAAFERTQKVPESRFDRYVAYVLGKSDQRPQYSAAEISGLRLFVGKANCTRCHNGPLLTNHGFANTGVPPRPGLPDDEGRAQGVGRAKADPFNCRGAFNDAAEKSCDELDFAVVDTPELVRAYKVPSLRGSALRPPYMHAGQLETLEEVLDHYNRAPRATSGHSELEPLRLNAAERRHLLAFLHSLNPVSSQ